MPRKKITVGTPTQALITQTDRQQAVQLVMSTLQKKYGTQALQRAGDIVPIARASTGLEELDAMLGGGIPVGRIIEVFGLTASGKTAVACQVASQAQTCVFIDAERKMTPEMVGILHLPLDTIIVIPEGIEHALEIARDFANVGTEMIIIDSLPALPSLKEVDEKDFGKITGISPMAGILSRKLPVLMNILDKHQSTLIIVNQQRANINAVAFGEQYHQFGGHALANYASVRIATARRAWLKHDVLGVYGMELALLVHKSSVSRPRVGVSLPNVFDYGLLPNEQVVGARKQLIAEYKAGNKEPREQPEVASDDRPFDKVSITEELNEMAGE